VRCGAGRQLDTPAPVAGSSHRNGPRVFLDSRLSVASQAKPKATVTYADSSSSPAINFLQHQLGGPSHPQIQNHMPDFLQHHHAYSPLCLSNTIGLSGSSPTRRAQAAAVGSSSTSANACGSALQGPHVWRENCTDHGRTRNYTYYSEALKRDFCLFKIKWLSAQSEGTCKVSWRSALLSFFKSRIRNCEGGNSIERASRFWWSQRNRYLTEQEVSSAQQKQEQKRVRPESIAGTDSHTKRSKTNSATSDRNAGHSSERLHAAPGRSGCGWGDSGLEEIDSTGGGLNDCMDDSHRGDAEQSEAGKGVFADEAQVQAQFPAGESPLSAAARAADAGLAASADASSDNAPPAAAAAAEGARAPTAMATATTGAAPYR
jgi:hypothetical protein